MTKKKRPGRRKHVPMRTCVACRESYPKRSLLRIVALPEQGLVIDSSGKQAGRGAYLCHNPDCWQTTLAARNTVLSHALRRPIEIEEKAALLACWEQEFKTGQAEDRQQSAA